MNKNVNLFLSDKDLANLEDLLNEPDWTSIAAGMVVGAPFGVITGPLLQSLGVINPNYGPISTMGIGAGVNATLGGLLFYLYKLYSDRSLLKQLRDYAKNKNDRELVEYLKNTAYVHDIFKNAYPW